MRRNALVITALAGILVFSTIAMFAENSDASTKALTSHAPIYINGNDDFSDADDDGVSNPNVAGTADDPYIIENWDIDASTALSSTALCPYEYESCRRCIEKK